LEPLTGPQRRKATTGGELPKGWKVEVDPDGKPVLTREDRKVPLQLQWPRGVLPELSRWFRSADNKECLIVVTAQGKRITIVDPETGKQIAAVGGLFDRVLDLAVSPDHKYLLVAGGAQMLPIYSLNKPDQVVLRVARRYLWSG